MAAASHELEVLERCLATQSQSKPCLCLSTGKSADNLGVKSRPSR